MSPSQGWTTLHNDPEPDRHSLLGGEWKVKARMQPGSSQNLWLNVQLPDGTWTYLVLDPHGRVLHQEIAATKKQCYERTAAALKAA